MCAPDAGMIALRDLHAAVAGAAELVKAERTHAGTSALVHAQTLLEQAMDRASTLREVLHG